MRKIILLLIFLSINFNNAVFADSVADGYSQYGFSFQPQLQAEQFQAGATVENVLQSNKAPTGESEENVCENELEENIFQAYGNSDSPSYLNRENIDVYDSNHGGDDFDLTD